MPTPTLPTALVLGCAGPVLSDEERRLFAEVQPLGFILFRRNCQDPAQVTALVAALRDAVGRADAPVLIDQEGGRVARLRPPHWPTLPAAGRIGAVADPDRAVRADPDRAARAAWLHGRLLADLLAPLGIDVDCAPVADVPVPGSSDVIGDRAFARDPALVARLAAAQAAGLLAGGVLPVVKHLPGHGRAQVDSHKELPRVDADWDTLCASDFAAFVPLANQGQGQGRGQGGDRVALGMVAHVLYTGIDAVHPASVSPTVIRRVIRDHIGFDGLLFSDDLSMEALAGDIPRRARAVLDAGCDIALHCNGDLAEMRALAAEIGPMGARSWDRWRAARATLPPHVDIVEAAALRAELRDLLGPWD